MRFARRLGLLLVALLSACSGEEHRPTTAAQATTSGTTSTSSTSSSSAPPPPPSSNEPPPPPQRIVELPGVDTSQLAPSEKAWFSEIVVDAPSPCGDPSTIETCIVDHRPCALCVPAAKDVARLVVQGEYKSDIRKWLGFRFAPQSVVDAIPLDEHPTLGRKDATIEIVEFADFECPHCGLVAPKMHALVEKDPKYANVLRLVFANMPLAAHAHAEPAARAAWAAHLQGKFWPMHDQLFAHQDALTDADLEGYAKAVGCDLGKWKKAFAADATKQRVADDYALGTKVGVEGTPTLFINRRKFVQLGNDEFETQLKRWIDEELTAKAK